MVKIRADAGILIIICLLFLAGTVGASDTSDISTSKDWVIANGVDQSTITVNVKNTTSPINGASVSFTVNDPVYGTMSPATVTTGPSGIAVSSFILNKKSGTAIITATINYIDGGIPVTIDKTVSQNIDHDVLTTTFTPATGMVGEMITFSVSIKDQWGNPIDNRRSDDTVSLSVSCPLPNDCQFVDGHFFSSEPDSYGNLVLPLQLGTKTGVTTIVMNPVQSLSQQIAIIDAVRDDTLSLTADISPATLTVPVGTGVFSFVYTLSDKFGNPVANQPILIQTSLGETQLTQTNTLGQTPVQTYGPKGSTSTVDITATVVNTPSITNQFTVAFANAQSTMTLSVSPLSMASLDYGGTSANVVVSVRNELANAISGEDITLTLDSCTVGGDIIACPSLQSYSGTTDADGKVTTQFIPGTFKSGTSLEESTLLTAQWTSSNPSYPPKTATLTWSNKPYLNIETTVSPDPVNQNEIIDVTIRISVSGKTGQEGPLTIVLDQDATANMGRGTPSLEEEATIASKNFIANLNEAKTRIGMETFGKATTDASPPVGYLNIPSTFSQVNAELDKMANLSLTGGAGGYYESLIRSEDKIIADGHPENVKIIVFLSDGGSILTEAEKSTLIAKATGDGTEAQKIRIMTICYTNNVNEPSGAAQLRDLSAATGGEAYIATNAGDLAAKYAELIDRIEELCGSGSIMTVSFGNIVINATTTMSDSEIYDYIPVDIPAGLPVGVMSAPSAAVNSGARTSIIWPNESQSIQNQSEQWPDLVFNVGQIKITETWSTTFRLKTKQPGCYNVFGSDSNIVFGGGSFPMTLPDLPICVNSVVIEKGLLNGTLWVGDLQTVPSGGNFTDFIPLQWNTKYNSSTSTNIATEYVSYRINGGPWNQVGAMSVPSTDLSQTITLSKTLDIRNLPSGNYDILVHATAADADDTDEQITVGVFGSGSRNIRLKLQ